MREPTPPGPRPRRSHPANRRRILSLEALEGRRLLTQIQYGLFDTGVDSTGAVLAGGVADAHYTMPVTQQGTAGQDAVVLSPINQLWIPNGTTAQWVGPTANQGANSTSPPGTYEYKTTFTVGSAGTGQLTGSLAGDDDLVDVLINGVSTGYSGAAGPRAFVPFSVTGNLVAGVNTIDFIVSNAGTTPNSTGFYAKDLALNFLPTVTVDTPTVNVPYRGSATDTGSFSDPDLADTVTITSSRGTVTPTGTNSGKFTYSESNITVGGPVTITATDSHGGTSTATFNLVVPAPTRTTLATSAPSVQFGSPVTLTASVGDLDDANTPTGGTVTFEVGGRTLGSASLLNGSASITTNTLPVGISTFTASYSGTSTFGPSNMVLEPTSPIQTYAGTGTAGYSGDGGDATAAKLNNPTGLPWTPRATWSSPIRAITSSEK